VLILYEKTVPETIGLMPTCNSTANWLEPGIGNRHRTPKTNPAEAGFSQPCKVEVPGCIRCLFRRPLCLAVWLRGDAQVRAHGLVALGELLLDDFFVLKAGHDDDVIT